LSFFQAFHLKVLQNSQGIAAKDKNFLSLQGFTARIGPYTPRKMPLVEINEGLELIPAF
jgi:hypothetical protein